MNIFIEKKTNIGFYNLKDPLGISLKIFSLNSFFTILFLSMFKLILKKNIYDDSSYFI
jgi:hypothetical protein